MAETITTYDPDIDTARETTYTNGKEPATRHDINEGGALGGVGGAVVGALAGAPGGPVGAVAGAVIGGIVGGLASAGAVDVVDKHDNDYDRTAYKDNEIDEDDDLIDSDTVVTDDLSGNRVYNTAVPVTAYDERQAVSTPSALGEDSEYRVTTNRRDDV